MRARVYSRAIPTSLHLRAERRSQADDSPEPCHGSAVADMKGSAATAKPRLPAPHRIKQDRTRQKARQKGGVMGFFSKEIETMDDLFVHTLRDIYYAENQIMKALPKNV